MSLKCFENNKEKPNVQNNSFVFKIFEQNFII